MKSTRQYNMEVRAQAAAQTRERVLAAVRELLLRQVGEPVTLKDIASSAGVSVPTVLRSFGSRSGALEAGRDLIVREMRELRRPTAPGDIAAAVAMLYAQ